MGKVVCSDCQMTFTTYSNLNLHKSEVHTAAPRAIEHASLARCLRLKSEARLPPPPPPPANELPPPPPMIQLPPPEEGVANENLPLQLSPASSVSAPTESEGMRAAAFGCD